MRISDWSSDVCSSDLDAKQAKLRSKQLFHWLYHRGETDFAHMTDLAKPMRGWMAERFIVGRPQVMEAQVSTDGTRKWLLRSDDRQDYEMVFLPDADRGKLCVSSQVGGTPNCLLCPTGTMLERETAVEGTGVSARGDPGGRRLIKKKKNDQ